ncbi:MAG: universal stress protein, partial [Gemmatimonadales bacterium]
MQGSLGSLQALRYAADEARQRNVPLLAVTAWVPPGGDMAERRHSSPYLRKIWREAAQERLWAAFDAGLGGVPAD